MVVSMDLIQPDDLLDRIPRVVDQHDRSITATANHEYALIQDVDADKSFIHQQVTQRFYSSYQPNDRALIVHGVGSGKCVHPSTLVTVNGVNMSIEHAWETIQGTCATDEDEINASWKIPHDIHTTESYNTEMKVRALGKIHAVYRQFVHEDLIQVTLKDDTTITMTQRHRVYTPHGWTNDISTQSLIHVSNQRAPIRVASVDIVPYMGYVYDFDIDHTHCYIANGIITHNTCTSALIYEGFRKTILSHTSRKPALVIVPSVSLAEQYMLQVVETCAKDEYAIDLEPPASRKGDMSIQNERKLTAQLKMRRIRAALKQSYTFETIEAFGERINRMNDETIIREFSNRDIIIDEVHVLRLKNEGARTLYEAYHRMLHIVKDSRVFLLTATPIWDRVHEIGDIFNLLLPLDQQFKSPYASFKKTFYKNGQLIPAQAIAFKNKIRGYLTYLRTRLESTNINRMGELDVYPGQMMPLTPVKLSKLHSKHAYKVFEDNKEASILHHTRTAARMVFPATDDQGNLIKHKIESGADAFAKNIKLVGKRYVWSNNAVAEQIKKHPSKYAAPFHKIYSIIRDNPKLVSVIFLDSIVSEGGQVGLALFLSLFSDIQWVTRVADIEEKQKPNEASRMVVFSSQQGTTNDAAVIQRMTQIINSPQNRYGKYCRVVIISRKTATGLDLHNVRQFFQFPYWHVSLMMQGRGRAERAGGHRHLPPEERFINEYVIAGVYSSRAKKIPSNATSIDIHVQKTAEKKYNVNVQILRAMIESAWDCAIMYPHNVKADDKDNSMECFYNQCNYQCDGYDDTQIDKTTPVWTYIRDASKIEYGNFLTYHADKIIRTQITAIKLLFKYYFNIPRDSLIALLDIQDRPAEYKTVDRALEWIIDNKEPIYDRYGNIGYLNEYKNVYYLTPAPILGSTMNDATTNLYGLIERRIPLALVHAKNRLESDKLFILDLISGREPLTYQAISKLWFTSIITFVELWIEYSPPGDAQNKILSILPKHIIRNGTQWVHDLATADYNERGFPEISKFEYHERIREYNPEQGIDRWQTISTDAVQALVTQFKRLHKQKEQSITRAQRKVDYRFLDWATIDTDVYGYEDDKGKFKIRIKKASDKDRDTTGAVCETSGWNIDRLLGVFILLDTYPSKKQHQNRNHDTKNVNVMRTFLSEIIDERFKSSIDTITDANIKRLYHLAGKTSILNKKELCQLAKWALTKNNVYFAATG